MGPTDLKFLCSLAHVGHLSCSIAQQSRSQAIQQLHKPLCISIMKHSGRNMLCSCHRACPCAGNKIMHPGLARQPFLTPGSSQSAQDTSKDCPTYASLFDSVGQNSLMLDDHQSHCLGTDMLAPLNSVQAAPEALQMTRADDGQQSDVCCHQADKFRHIRLCASTLAI